MKRRTIAGIEKPLPVQTWHARDGNLKDYTGAGVQKL